MKAIVAIERFQSTLPVRGATEFFDAYAKRHKISIHAPRAGSDQMTPKSAGQISISIHAPRAGSDCLPGLVSCVFRNFNPRSPCGERPGRSPGGIPGREDFNPRSPCGERREAGARASRGFNFNPRSPCGERHEDGTQHNAFEEFQSTLPVRGATDSRLGRDGGHKISIHAPRAGSDGIPRSCSPPDSRFQSTLPVRGATMTPTPRPSTPKNFNPRSPCGERLTIQYIGNGRDAFQSTLPVRGATITSEVSV